MFFENRLKHNFIIKCLEELNVVRNELAHEPLFDIKYYELGGRNPSTINRSKVY